MVHAAHDGIAASDSSSSSAQVADLQAQVQQLKQEVLVARQRYLDLAEILNVRSTAEGQLPTVDTASAAVGSPTKAADGAQPKGLPSLFRRPQTRKGLYTLQALAVQGAVQGICMNAS